MAPAPYSGPRHALRERIGAPHALDTFDYERSGTVEYAFNELGYRGPSYDPDAAFTVFVFGESDAFGLGVALDDAWPLRVARAVAERRGIAPSDVCVMNFADSGASNTYVARMVVTQCARRRPDLVLVNFAEDRRVELLRERVPFTAGPWMDLPTVDDELAAAPESIRDGLVEQVTRGRAHLRACDGRQGLYDTLREMLLVQSVLASRGLEAFAVSRTADRYTDDEILDDPVLGPLAQALDPWFLVPTGTESLIDGDSWQDEGQHFTSKGHAAIAEAVLAHVDAGAQQGASHVEDIGARHEITERVRDFYRELPFNFHGTEESAIDAIRAPTIETTYPDLHQRLVAETQAGGDAPRVLEVGCGAGWLTHSLALHYGVEVDALDITRPALERAHAIGERLGTAERVSFRHQDVFEWAPTESYDLAVSMGVLHHTRDPRGGLARMVRALRPHGHVYVGLYHAPARRVFLEEMWRIAREQGEEAAFRRYRELDAVHADDETLARSWFRDQVLHPHETQHTIGEVQEWFDELGVELVSTSINRFKPITSRLRLMWNERRYRAMSKRALFQENRYFPGFFTALGRRLG